MLICSAITWAQRLICRSKWSDSKNFTMCWNLFWHVAPFWVCRMTDSSFSHSKYISFLGDNVSGEQSKMYFCDQTRWLRPSQIVFAALQNQPLRWGAWIQVANQTCTYQPFLPKVGKNTLTHDSFFFVCFLTLPPFWNKNQLQNFILICYLILTLPCLP